jgi:hypothetical protein
MSQGIYSQHYRGSDLVLYSATGEKGTFKHLKPLKAYAELDLINGKITQEQYDHIIKFG